MIRTGVGSIEIPDAAFNRPAEEVQRDILDFLDEARERPAGHASAFADVARSRFAEPLELHASRRNIGTAAAFLLVPAAAMGLAAVTPSPITIALAGVSVALFGYIFWHELSHWRTHRSLTVGPDGLRVGARTIPWTTLRLVRHARSKPADAGQLTRAESRPAALASPPTRATPVLASGVRPT